MLSFRTNQFTVKNILTYALISIIGSSILLYIIFQARFLIQGPIIVLNNNPKVAQTQRVLNINGSVKNAVKITLNDRPIFIDESGYFEEELILENGYTIMTLRAEDRYGREQVLTHSFVYTEE